MTSGAEIDPELVLTWTGLMGEAQPLFIDDLEGLIQKFQEEMPVGKILSIKYAVSSEPNSSARLKTAVDFIMALTPDQRREFLLLYLHNPPRETWDADFTREAGGHDLSIQVRYEFYFSLLGLLVEKEMERGRFSDEVTRGILELLEQKALSLNPTAEAHQFARIWQKVERSLFRLDLVDQLVEAIDKSRNMAPSAKTLFIEALTKNRADRYRTWLSELKAAIAPQHRALKSELARLRFRLRTFLPTEGGTPQDASLHPTLTDVSL